MLTLGMVAPPHPPASDTFMCSPSHPPKHTLDVAPRSSAGSPLRLRQPFMHRTLHAIARVSQIDRRLSAAMPAMNFNPLHIPDIKFPKPLRFVCEKPIEHLPIPPVCRLDVDACYINPRGLIAGKPFEFDGALGSLRNRV